MHCPRSRMIKILRFYNLSNPLDYLVSRLHYCNTAERLCFA